MRLAVPCFLLAFLFAHFSQAQEFSYKINGKLSPSKKKTEKAYLRLYDPLLGQEHIDSTLIHKGRFEFSGKATQPMKALIKTGERYERGKYYEGKYLYLEPGTIRVKAKEAINKASIKGGEVNRQFAELDALLAPSQQKIDSLNNVYATADDTLKKSYAFMGPLLYKIDTIEKQEQAPVMLQFIKKHPASVVSLDQAIELIDVSNPNLGRYDTLMAVLAAEVKDLPKATALNAIVGKVRAIAIGQEAPLFAQKDPAGKELALVDFRGKYVLLDFWASWCTPCREANPGLVTAYNRFKDRNFTILGISLDNSRESWLKAIKEDQLEWPQVSDLKFWNNEVAKTYNVKMIPQNLLIDPEGTIVAKNIGMEKLAEFLAERE